MIAIIDYDIGNISAVANMLRRLGVRSVMTANASDIEAAERIILPGNGSFDACVKNLRSTGLVPLLEKKVLQQGTPLLGICVGAQMLGTTSEEGIEPGLGWLDLQVRRFPKTPGLKIPHMGWNQVKPASADHRLTRGLDVNARFYFVHSYYLAPADQADVLLTAKYGTEFVAGVSRGNVSGVQFHPEKSHRFGKQLLAAFAGAD